MRIGRGELYGGLSKVLWAVLVLAGIITVGTIGYTMLEGWPLLESS